LQTNNQTISGPKDENSRSKPKGVNELVDQNYDFYVLEQKLSHKLEDLISKKMEHIARD
jgi:hypothetical protein